MHYHSINNNKDISHFLEKTNWLHDGYIIGVEYRNDGITKIDKGGYFIEPERTRLFLRILVTSILNTVVEMEFTALTEWQIKENQWEILDTFLGFDEQGNVVWADSESTDKDELKEGSYIVAKSMRWRIAE